MSALWDSKKFKAALTASLLALLATYLGYTVEQVLAIVSPLLTYVGFQGVVDFAKEGASKLKDATKPAE